MMSLGHRERGQAALEFALTALLLVIMLMGIADFARFYFTYASISHAAREAARYGILHPTWRTAADNPDPDNMVARAERVMSWVGSNTTVQVTYPDGGWPAGVKPGRRLKVTVQTTLQPLTPLIPMLQLTAESVMYIEGI